MTTRLPFGFSSEIEERPGKLQDAPGVQVVQVGHMVRPRVEAGLKMARLVSSGEGKQHFEVSGVRRSFIFVSKRARHKRLDGLANRRGAI